MNNSSESATASISNALRIFFDFVDGRHELDEALPPNVTEAFREIISYYTPRLSSVLRLDPDDRLYCPDFLYNYAWTQLWRFGQNITRNRTVAGVFMWLKRTLCRRQSEILKFYALERKLMFCVDACVNDESSFADGDAAYLVAELQCPRFDKTADAQYRFNLLYGYYRTALARLNQRQQQIIKLSKLHAMFRNYRQDFGQGAKGQGAEQEARGKGVREQGGNSEYEKEDYASLTETKAIMSFGSIDAVKAFKRRALKALVKELSLLFKSDLDQASGDVTRREILEEWLESYCESRRAGRVMKSSVLQTIALCLLACSFACG